MKHLSIVLIIVCAACNNAPDPSLLDQPKAGAGAGTPSKIEGLDVLSFSIHTPTDTIDYIKVGTDTTAAKPTILFLQGSLPAPLIFDMGTFKQVNLPFDASLLIKQYNVVEISMPKTPLSAGLDHLDADFNYVPDTAKPNIFSPTYLQANYLDNYVARADRVIADLMERSWVKKDSLILIGHSQGAKVAAVVAAENKHIASVALLGFNAFGRYDELVRRERNKLRSERLTSAEYQARLDSLYRRWKAIHASPNDAASGHLAWTTFSIDYVPYLLRIDVPIFIGYGTEDPIAENCDLLPLAFISHGKSNYTLRPYVGLDHNFFELRNGIPDHKNGAHWARVIGDVLQWSHIGKSSQ